MNDALISSEYRRLIITLTVMIALLLALFWFFSLRPEKLPLPPGGPALIGRVTGVEENSFVAKAIEEGGAALSENSTRVFWDVNTSFLRALPVRIARLDQILESKQLQQGERVAPQNLREGMNVLVYTKKGSIQDTSSGPPLPTPDEALRDPTPRIKASHVVITSWP